MKTKTIIITATSAAVAAVTILIVLTVLRKKNKHDTSNDMNTLIPAQGYDLTKRGYRNNNPGNIRISSNAWQGKVSPNTDGTFEQFRTMAYGFRAMLKNIQTYIRVYRCQTVRDIVSKWAPPTENHTDKYISTVCSWTGFSADTPISYNNKAQMTALASAIARYENGSAPLAKDVNEGWNLL